MNLRTPLARARGLGSAKSGTHHWWMQRLTAVALVPLSLWFVASLINMATANHATVVAWLNSPVAAVLLCALIVAIFYHGQLGLQVVVEDYVHGAPKTVTLIASTLAHLFIGCAGIYSVLRVGFGA